MEILNYMQEENEITEVCESVYTTTEITFTRIRRLREGAGFFVKRLAGSTTQRLFFHEF